jgi:predicted signal transduction protein with EAL and GGDEF domain
VETLEQLRFLQRLGCNNMQGYLFSRPLPGEQFKMLLARPGYRLNDGNHRDPVLAARDLREHHSSGDQAVNFPISLSLP